MMKHEDIWRAIDTLAAENGLSASGLAKRSGLDPTTFNVSKRVMPDGRNRWPSTESVAKVLNATGASLEAFTSLVSGARTLASNLVRPARRVPLIGLAQAGGEGYFDDGGFPVGFQVHGGILGDFFGEVIAEGAEGFVAGDKVGFAIDFHQHASLSAGQDVLGDARRGFVQ